MEESYRNRKKQREFKINQELNIMRRFQRDALFYLQVIMWIGIGTAAIAFGIFIRLLLFS